MLTVRVYRSQFGPITLKTRTYSGAVAFLNKLDNFGVLASNNYDSNVPMPVYYWLDLWFEDAQPFAEITGDPE